MGTAAVRGGNGRWGVLAAVVVAGVLGWGFAVYAGDVYHREIGGPLQHCAKVGSLAGPAVAAAVMAPLLSAAGAVAAGWVAVRSSRSPLLLVAGGVLAVAAALFAVGEVFNAVDVLSGPHTWGNTCE